ncbi:putative 26S proteasome non-ATPase regulatory subunit 9 [Grifola frondosa]|uniref:Probable 26S proteasome regulatory subunit p27 n=1 Tax=Grifola frondosa TaxID=5627 RepID=A0A1C7M8E7_GRIFR|nr:putative 26S proteasome non-ATPase regulatory subunit 9 [Grifola frondosa]
MGFSIPPRNTPAEHVRTLMTRKDAIEAEMDAQLSILTANSSTMDTPLLDPEGFPRADIDVWAVRVARVRIIELRNDLKALMDSIMEALQIVYDPAAVPPPEPAQAEAPSTDRSQPFAKVSGVAPQSPAAAAGLRRDDLVVAFGHLTKSSFESSSLQPLVEFVTTQENRIVVVEVLRAEETVRLEFTPRSGWGGRGLLGCHIVPYSPS